MADVAFHPVTRASPKIGAVTPMQRFKLRLAVLILNLAAWSAIIWGLRQCL